MGSELSKIISEYRGLIITSLVLSLLLGGAAAIYPISFIAHLSIPNNEGFFSLTELKRIKNRLPIEARALIDQETDPALKKYLEKSALEPKWIDKNISATLALTKADAKDALANPNDKIDAFRVEWMNVETNSKKEELAKSSARWLGETICEINFKEGLTNYIAEIRAKSDEDLKKIYDQLPGIEKSISQMQENIKILRDINQKFPESASDASRLQLNLSAGENKDNLSSLSFLTAYLPPIKQLAILEAQLAQTIDTKKRLNLEKDVIEAKREAASRELEAFDAKPLRSLADHARVTYDFWSRIDFSKALPANAPEWVSNYVAEIKNQLRAEERIRAAHFDRQMSQLDMIFTEEKYERLWLVVGAMLAGLLVPGLLYLSPAVVRRLMSASSDA
jgi:hypothetical protein